MSRSKPNWLERFAALDPVMLRGVVVTVFALLGAVGISVSDGLVAAVLAFVVALGALVTALVSRPAVTPNEKVLVYKPDPFDAPGTVAAGHAVVAQDRAQAVAELATRRAK